ncbi:hypothetical protein C8J57DRAFT_1225826 [Mycena rebaudengoi]|nr:hypothetical protein C8J57DRAFT_1225826 [Mycena rebaudengoi]
MSVLWSPHLRTFLVTFPHPLLHLCFSIGSLSARSFSDRYLPVLPLTSHALTSRPTTARLMRPVRGVAAPHVTMTSRLSQLSLFDHFSVFRIYWLLQHSHVPSSGLMANFSGLRERLLSSKSYSTNTVIVQAFSEVVYVTNGFPIVNRPLTVHFSQRWFKAGPPLRALLALPRSHEGLPRVFPIW